MADTSALIDSPDPSPVGGAQTPSQRIPKGVELETSVGESKGIPHRRGSGTVHSTGGMTAYHTRNQDGDELPHLEKSRMSAHLRKYESLFTVGTPRMKMISEGIKEAFAKGLEKDGEIVPMIPTFVFGYPTGKEVGDFIALDLGGTNLRVCFVTLQGDGKFEITQTKYRLTEEQKQEDGVKLFDFCAVCVKDFLKSHMGIEEGSERKDLVLGFTFSYPCSQDKIDHGVLIRWTKGFGNPGVEGVDCAELFRAALKKHNVPITLSALINDTTGALIASNYLNPNTKMAVIFGTGCNAAYMETVENIPKMAHLGLPPKQEMAINCEWGAFDSFAHQYLPRTKYDIIIDQKSNKPGEQSFEKMIAGLYLGEVFRLVLCELIDEGELFLGQITYKIEKPYAFDTAFLSLIEADETDEGLMIVGIFSHFFGLETSQEERNFFKSLAKLVGRRAARLSACGIAAIVSKKGYVEEGCDVGADGSLYNKYPKFAERIHEALVEIFGEQGNKIKTHHAEDGSGVGSAIIAAMTKIRKDNQYFVNL